MDTVHDLVQTWNRVREVFISGCALVEIELNDLNFSKLLMNSVSFGNVYFSSFKVYNLLIVVYM